MPSYKANKINVLYVHHSSALSGAEVSLELLIQGIDRERYQLTVILPDNKGPLARRLKEIKIPVEYVPLKRFKRTKNPFILVGYLFSTIVCSLRIYKIIRNQNVSLIHSNSTTAHIYSSFAALLAAVPCVWHVRDLGSRFFIERSLRSLSSRIICISQCVADQKAFSGSIKVRVVPNALNLDIWTPTVSKDNFRNRYELDPGHLIIAQVGQLVPWKNHKDMIRLAQQILPKFDRARFLVIGSDLFGDNSDYEKALKKEVHDKGLANFFIFIPFMHPIMEVLNEIDILCHPAVNEPFGRVILEAMALKKPVVAINSCGAAEIITNDENGYLVAPHDINKMTEKVMRLLNDSVLRSDLGNSARRRVEESYDSKQQAKVIEGIYSELLR